MSPILINSSGKPGVDKTNFVRSISVPSKIVTSFDVTTRQRTQNIFINGKITNYSEKLERNPYKTK